MWAEFAMQTEPHSSHFAQQNSAAQTAEKMSTGHDRKTQKYSHETGKD